MSLLEIRLHFPGLVVIQGQATQCPRDALDHASLKPLSCMDNSQGLWKLKSKTSQAAQCSLEALD